MADLADRFWNAPPVTRTVVAATFVESALFYGGVVPANYIVYVNSLIFGTFPPQLWRLLSPFLVTGGGFSFVFDLFMLWTYSSGLELNSPRFSQPGDFFVYVAFIFTVIWITAGVILHNIIFTSAFLLALVYTYAQDNRGKKAHFIIVQIPVEYLPWAMLTLSFIMGGPQAAMGQGTGVIAAHMYDFLTRLYPTFQAGRNWIQTPAAIKRYFGADGPSVSHKGYGTGFRPGQAVPPQQSRGWTSALGGSGGAWGSRGSGRRLGGD